MGFDLISNIISNANDHQSPSPSPSSSYEDQLPDELKQDERVPSSISMDRSTGSSSSSLSLFRSYSMPIPSSNSTVRLNDLQQVLGRVQDDGPNLGDEDEEDHYEVLATPLQQEPSSVSDHCPATTLRHHHHYSSAYQSIGQRLLSSSLPPSLDRRRTGDGIARHHENPLDELLQLTQPMREGIISRENLLPSSRMKQVGIGGRGRRPQLSKMPSNSATCPLNRLSISDQSDPSSMATNLPSSPSISPSNSSLRSSIDSTFGFAAPIVVSPQTPLIRPRPILAWQRPTAT